MIPEWKQRQLREQRQKQSIEFSKSRYIGLGFTIVGFALLLITILTGGKLQKEYGLFVLFMPVLSAMGIGLIFGSFNFVISATKIFIEIIVDFYVGVDYDELKKKLK